MRKLAALLCTLAFTAAVGGAAMAGPGGCSGYDEHQQSKAETTSS